MDAATMNRHSGCLYGLAAGDRNGGPIRMALLLGQSLVACRHFDPEDVSRRYLHWWCNGAFDTGPTFAAVYREVARGASVADAVFAVHLDSDGQTAGVNPAHRCAPLALCGDIPDGQLAIALRTEARLSHLHELAGETSVAVGLLCRHLVRGLAFENALGTATADRPNAIRRAASLASEVGIGPGGFAPQAFAAGIHFVTSSQSFAEALQRALDFAGPANYCPVITGAVAGARWGRQEIAPHMLQHCERLEEIEQLLYGLRATWERS